MATLHLAKYHGLGNDFLVLVPAAQGAGAGGSGRSDEGIRSGGGIDAVLIDATVVAVLCDRHRGVGADGVIALAATADPSTVRMTLRNADGGLAETSGNGLRCAVLAALDGGLVRGPELVVETLAGPARAHVVARNASGGATVRVSMGRALLGEVRPGVLGRFARLVDTGNPHLVLYPDGGRPAPLRLRAEELSHLEHGVDGEVAGGLNVEAVTVTHADGRGADGRGGDGQGGDGQGGDGRGADGQGGDGQGGDGRGGDGRGGGASGGAAAGEGADVVELVVWERGAGATLACGSGSVAAAAACRAAGLVGGRVEVRNPGGALLVELSGALEAPEAYLTGPAQLVARIEVDLDWVLESAAAAVGDSREAGPGEVARAS